MTTDICPNCGDVFIKIGKEKRCFGCGAVR